MADIIERIGEYFAKREHEQQSAIASVVTQSPSVPPVRQRSEDLSLAARRRAVRRASLEGAPSSNAHVPPSLVRRCLSFESPNQSHPPVPATQLTNRQPEHGSSRTAIRIPSISQLPQIPTRQFYDDADACSDDNGASLASWRSMVSLTDSNSSCDTQHPPPGSKGDAETTFKRMLDPETGTLRKSNQRSTQTKPKSRKRKAVKHDRSATAEAAALDAREKIDRVAVGLALAQERTKRRQDEAQQAASVERQAQRAATERIKAQLERIEEIRAKSMPSRPVPASSTPLSPAFSSDSSSPSSSIISQDAPARVATQSQRCRLVVGADEPENTSQITESVLSCDGEEPPIDESDGFIKTLETRMRNQMQLHLQFRHNCLAERKRQDRVLQQLERAVGANKSNRVRIASLEAGKGIAERELARVLEELNALRRQRRDLEETARNERLRRQKEAERALQRRLREEEWAKLMDEEKARSAVAASARDRASERVLQTRISNQKLAALRAKQVAATSRVASRRAILQMLPPELADFEEEGLGRDVDWESAKEVPTKQSKPTSNQEEEEVVEMRALPFKWQVPPSSSIHNHDAILFFEMVSDDDE